MRIGLLLPSIYTSHRYGSGRIFAPKDVAVALADGLVGRGHEVTSYTSRDVATKATIVPGDSELTDRDLAYFLFRNRDKLEQQYTVAEIVKRDFEYGLTLAAYQDAVTGKLDIIHSFHDFGAHYFNELTKFPTVYTIHDPLPQTDTTIEYQRLKKFAHHNFVSISNSQRRGIVDLNFAATVYHGLDISAYDFQPKHSDYLIHFGRIMEDKGTDVAIEVAKQVGMPIHLATSTLRANRSQDFYDQKIAPLVDGKTVCLAGFLEGKEKSSYIGAGRAFVFPLAWEEPFGMVMIEAMACGTPVIAYNRGSVAEIVKDGVTGYIVDPDDNTTNNPINTNKPINQWVIKKRGVEGLVEAVKRIGEIDRAACRRHVEEHFTIEKMVEGYEKVYEKVSQSSKIKSQNYK